MDDTDATRTDDGPFDEPLIPAVRRVGGEVDAFERESVPAVEPERDGDERASGASRAARETGETGETVATGKTSETGRRADSPFDADLVPAVRRVEDDERIAGTDGTAQDVAVGPNREAATSEAVADVEELVGPRQRLEPRIQLVWILQSGISAAVFGVMASIAFALLPVGEPWWGMVVFTVLFVLGAAFAVLRYRIWSYEVREDSLFLRRGVVTRVTTVAPYVRIQHVDVRRGAIERTFGLATTVVYTAGSRGADVSIPGLTPDRANDLQDRLKQLAIAAEGEDAV